MSKLLYTTSTWTIADIDKIWQCIQELVARKYQLDYYRPQFEVISCDQMIQRMATGGRPNIYSHWSFGKAYELQRKDWESGNSGMPYEMIFHADPAPCYLMEDNSTTMQVLVLAHAAVGHGSFFKGNYLMREWVNAKAVLPRITHAREFIKECEAEHGVDKVEKFIDACHALSAQGVDRFKRGRAKSSADLQDKLRNRIKAIEEEEESLHGNVNENLKLDVDSIGGWRYPDENILYFIEKNGPMLEPWQREIIRIVRTQQQYFFPNYQTKLMNEGWASFWHYTICKDLYDEGFIDEGAYLEILHNHTNVAHEHPSSCNHNPYALGFEIFSDLRRACENPTAEDYEYLPLVAGKPWIETLKWVMENFKDQSFIKEFLGPNVVKKFKLFAWDDLDAEMEHRILGVQDIEDVYVIRDVLSETYTYDYYFPTINVNYMKKDTRELYLGYVEKNGVKLDPETQKETTKHIRKLWGLPVHFETFHESGDRLRTTILRW